MFQKQSILVKMLITSSCLVTFLIVVGTAGMYSLRETTRLYDHVATINLPNSELLSDMHIAQLEISRSYYRIASASASSEEIAKRLQIIDESKRSYEANDAKYREVPFAEGEEKLYEALDKSWRTFMPTVERVLEPAKNAKNFSREAIEKATVAELSELRSNHGKAMEALKDFHSKEASKWSSEAKETAKTFSFLMIAFVAAGALIGMAIAFFSSRSLSKILESIASQISESGSQVRTASEQLSVASQSLSSGATEAASALEETVASVEELSSMVKLNSDNAREASLLSQKSSKSAEEGETEIGKLNEAIREIAQSSKKIEEIINVIDDIAFQTNLLALNAAVEAARAGEQGKGFAVVAEAVRTLAQRSSSAAKDITSLIKESVSRIERGEKMANESGTVLKNIVSSVNKVASLNNEIATASQEQSHGLSQISKAMNELDVATQRNASSAEETAASSEEMSSQAICLEDLVLELYTAISGESKGAPMQTAKNNFSNVRKINSAPARKVRLQPNRRAQNLNAKAIIPLDDDELSQRKIGNIEGF